jgi:hypothetical protein
MVEHVEGKHEKFTFSPNFRHIYARTPNHNGSSQSKGWKNSRTPRKKPDMAKYSMSKSTWRIKNTTPTAPLAPVAPVK